MPPENYRQTADVLTERMPQLRGAQSVVRFGTAGMTSVLFLIMIGIAAASLGEFERSRLALEEASEIAQQTGRPYDLVACSYCRVFFAPSPATEMKLLSNFERDLIYVAIIRSICSFLLSWGNSVQSCGDRPTQPGRQLVGKKRFAKPPNSSDTTLRRFSRTTHSLRHTSRRVGLRNFLSWRGRVWKILGAMDFKELKYEFCFC